MLIGVDFDNTIVCYDELFWRIARERELVPADTPVSKGGVRDELRRAGREEAWTELQGEVYGVRLPEAQPFPGVLRFFRHCRQAGVPARIISHRTRRPYRGPDHDLHQAARDWLAAFGFHAEEIGLGLGHVHLELSKSDKLARIAAARCTHFIDDLPEIFTDPAFPAGIGKLLFDPNNLHAQSDGAVRRLASWAVIEQELFPETR